MFCDISDDLDATINAIDRAELTEATEADYKRMLMRKTHGEHDQNNTKVSMRRKRKMTKKQRMMEKEKRRERKRQMKEKKRMMRLQLDNKKQKKVEKVDCMVTQWTQWEDCTQKCGKQYIERIRMIKRQPENGGKKCPKKLSRRRKCKLPKCRKLDFRLINIELNIGQIARF